MVAAKIGIGLAHERIFGNPAVLPLSLTALSIDQLTHLVRHEVYITNPENIERLVWRKSLPVIHLAIAVQLMLTGRFKDRSEWGCDLQDVDFYRQAVLLAQALEPVVLNHAKINITSDKLTRLRWYE